MINPMNIGDRSVKKITLHGNHQAKTVYCTDLMLGGNYGTLHCDNIVFIKPEDKIDMSALDYDDRVYYGDVYVYDAYVQGLSKLVPSEVEECTQTTQD